MFAKTLRKWFEGAENEVFVISPYMTPSALEECLSKIDERVAVTIICSWRTTDLVSGSSSLAIYDLCKERGWCLRVNHDGSERVLHLKAYVVDGSMAMVGSANMTRSGLGTNIETLVEVEIAETGNSVTESFEHSIKVDDTVYDSIKEHLSQIEVKEEEELPCWNPPDEENAIILAVMDAMPPRPTHAELVGLPSLGRAMSARGLRFSEVRRVISEHMDYSRGELSDATERIMEKIATDPRMDLQTGPHGHHTKCLVWKLEEILTGEVMSHLEPHIGKPISELGLDESLHDKSLRGSRSKQIREVCLSLLPEELREVVRRMSTWDATISLRDSVTPKENRPVGPNIYLESLPAEDSRPEILDVLWLSSFCIYQADEGTTLGDVVLLGFGFWEPEMEVRGSIAREFEEDIRTIRENSQRLLTGDKASLETETSREFVFVKVRGQGGRSGSPLGSPERPICHYLTKRALSKIAKRIV